MKEYKVLKPFAQFNAGDKVQMLERQAKYLLMNGTLERVEESKPVADKKTTKKGTGDE